MTEPSGIATGPSGNSRSVASTRMLGTDASLGFLFRSPDGAKRNPVTAMTNRPGLRFASSGLRAGISIDLDDHLAERLARGKRCDRIAALCERIGFRHQRTDR